MSTDQKEAVKPAQKPDNTNVNKQEQDLKKETIVLENPPKKPEDKKEQENQQPTTDKKEQGLKKCSKCLDNLEVKKEEKVVVNAKDKKRLTAIFKEDPLLKGVYQTSDGYFFKTKGLAKSHAKTLTEKEVIVLTKNN
ncbi:hypothetical protein PL373_07955 [Tenacibaculum maritimum]|nr:hypothetical protein [Tenacibaculum maritimum]MDB0601079.1 hypothetical protein [Tenacibaculum maritimum]MDB0612160.1 hypothetical protein [Tenacibaculum maritimum]